MTCLVNTLHNSKNINYINDLQCLMLSENALSGIAFLRKFSIDLRRAARCGKHCIPVNQMKI